MSARIKTKKCLPVKVELWPLGQKEPRFVEYNNHFTVTSEVLEWAKKQYRFYYAAIVHINLRQYPVVDNSTLYTGENFMKCETV